jgi:ABC-type glycerol-3-phosphate transport system permease component
MIKTSEFVSSADMGYLPSEIQRNVTSTTVRYATIVISTIPILCIYPLLQRFLTKGIMLGSLKG